MSLPFSKGLMASRLAVTGLSPERAYAVAQELEERIGAGRPSPEGEAFEELVAEVLGEVAGERYARSWERWRVVRDLRVPLVLLIGGATGVGKSTIATQLATRLGIVRVVATDAIREVMRALFSGSLMPTLHTSSFEAGSALREPTRDAAIAGFREQAATVGVGVAALLDRAAVEGTGIIIEGAHVVPGSLDLTARADRILAVPVIVTVEDEALHRSHFPARWADRGGRPPQRYLDGFEDIRRIQRFLKSQALSHGVPVISNYNLDHSIAQIIELVMERGSERAAATPMLRRREGA